MQGNIDLTGLGALIPRAPHGCMNCSAVSSSGKSPLPAPGSARNAPHYCKPSPRRWKLPEDLPANAPEERLSNCLAGPGWRWKPSGGKYAPCLDSWVYA